MVYLYACNEMVRGAHPMTDAGTIVAILANPADYIAHSSDPDKAREVVNNLQVSQQGAALAVQMIMGTASTVGGKGSRASTHEEAVPDDALPHGYEPDNDLLSNKPSGEREYNPSAPNSGTANPELTKPYDPLTTRADLEATHGTDNVTSSTVVNNPTQRVNSDPSKGVEVITDSYGNKAVKVDYVDPVTKEPLKANIPYDSRGQAIFDDVAKYTTKIDEGLSYTAQMRQATRDLRDGINSGRVNASQFTADQLKAIQSGKSVIPDYTWHHNSQAAPNSMQLIPKTVHDEVLHIGQGALSQGK